MIEMKQKKQGSLRLPCMLQQHTLTGRLDQRSFLTRIRAHLPLHPMEQIPEAAFVSAPHPMQTAPEAGSPTRLQGHTFPNFFRQG